MLSETAKRDLDAIFRVVGTHLRITTDSEHMASLGGVAEAVSTITRYRQTGSVRVAISTDRWVARSGVSNPRHPILVTLDSLRTAGLLERLTRNERPDTDHELYDFTFTEPALEYLAGLQAEMVTRPSPSTKSAPQPETKPNRYLADALF